MAYTYIFTLVDGEDVKCIGLNDLFYSENHASEELAKSICSTCFYSIPCAESAIKNDEWGTWGKTTRKERLAFKRAQMRNEGKRIKRAYHSTAQYTGTLKKNI